MIRRFINMFSFPMLSKELLELAQQKRTYAIRFVYCIAFYIFVLFNLLPIFVTTRDPIEMLGVGRNILNTVNWNQCLMILLFMPIISSGTIAYEKERNTLQLLLLTRLSPGNIVFEKFLSRFITMCGFLLMSLPLMAIAYALGGVDSRSVWYALLTQLLLTFLIGAVSLACSSWCTTAFSALLSTYFTLLGLAVIGSCCTVNYVFTSVGPGVFRGGPITAVIFNSLLSAPAIIIGLGFLLLARNVLISRSVVLPTHYFLKLFRRLDAAFHAINKNRVTRGIEVLKSVHAFPEVDPVAWRERTHSLAGSPTHLMRLFSLMMIPLSVVLMFTLTESRATVNSLGGVVVVLWIISLLVVFFASVPLIIKERNQQTLDVLLSVPLATDCIIEQKLAGVRRLINLFQAILWLVLVCHLYMTYRDGSEYIDVLILLFLGVSHRLQLMTVAWLGLLLGAWQKHLVRALGLGIIGVFLLWEVIPRFLIANYAAFIFDIYYPSIFEEFFPRQEMEWIAPALEICLSPLWITRITWNFSHWRDSIFQFPASLLIGLIYLYGNYRFIRSWAFRRSKRDLPRLVAEESRKEICLSSDQTSPAIGNP